MTINPVPQLMWTITTTQGKHYATLLNKERETASHSGEIKQSNKRSILRGAVRRCEIQLKSWWNQINTVAPAKRKQQMELTGQNRQKNNTTHWASQDELDLEFELDMQNSEFFFQVEMKLSDSYAIKTQVSRVSSHAALNWTCCVKKAHEEITEQRKKNEKERKIPSFRTWHWHVLPCRYIQLHLYNPV